MSLKRYPRNSWNPQSNALLEQTHQVLIGGLIIFNTLSIHLEELYPFGEYLTFVSYTIRPLYHQLHGHSPAQLVFRRDIFCTVSCINRS